MKKSPKSTRRRTSSHNKIPHIGTDLRVDLSPYSMPRRIAQLADSGQWDSISRERKGALMNAMTHEIGLRFQQPVQLEPGEYRGPGISMSFLNAGRDDWSPRAVALYSTLRAYTPQRGLSLKDVEYLYPFMGKERALRDSFAELVKQGYAQRVYVRRDRKLVGNFCLTFDRPIPKHWRIQKAFCWHILPDGENAELRSPTKELLDPVAWFGRNLFRTLGRLVQTDQDGQVVPWEGIWEDLDNLKVPEELGRDFGGLNDDQLAELWQVDLATVERIRKTPAYDNGNSHIAQAAAIRALEQAMATKLLEDQPEVAEALRESVQTQFATPESVRELSQMDRLPGAEVINKNNPQPLEGAGEDSIERVETITQTPDTETQTTNPETPNLETITHQPTNHLDSGFTIPALPTDLEDRLLSLRQTEGQSQTARATYELTLRRELFGLMTTPPEHERMSTWSLSWANQSATGLAFRLLAGGQPWNALLARRFVKRLQKGYITPEQIQDGLLNTGGLGSAPSLEALLAYAKSPEGQVTNGWEQFLQDVSNGHNLYRNLIVKDLRAMVESDEPASISNVKSNLTHHINDLERLATMSKSNAAIWEQQASAGLKGLESTLVWLVRMVRTGQQDRVTQWVASEHDRYHDQITTNATWFSQAIARCNRTTLLLWQLFEAELEPLMGQYPWEERRTYLEILDQRAEAHGLRMRVVFDDHETRQRRWRILEPMLDYRLPTSLPASRPAPAVVPGRPAALPSTPPVVPITGGWRVTPQPARRLLTGTAASVAMGRCGSECHADRDFSWD
jgi:hypothetical protein